MEVIPIDRHTGSYYSVVRGALFRKHGTKEMKRELPTFGEKHPEQLIDKSTGDSLGIDENDLWIVASAVEHKMTFVTFDKMVRLKDIVMKNLKLPIVWITLKL